MKEGYECLRSAYVAGPCEGNARAGVAVRERSGCLVLTPYVIASGVPKGRRAICGKIPRFVGKSVHPRGASAQAHEWTPTFMCVRCVKATTLWKSVGPEGQHLRTRAAALRTRVHHFRTRMPALRRAEPQAGPTTDRNVRPLVRTYRIAGIGR